MAIDNQFGKGIGVAAGFDLGAQKPLDARIAVNTIAERDAHVDNNRAYEGMVVFVDETKKSYQLINGVWVELLKAEQDRLAALEAMLNGEGEEGQAGGALGALQDNIDAEANRAKGVEQGLQTAIDTINNAESGILAQAKALDKVDRDAQALVDKAQDDRLKALEDANAEGGAVKEAIDKVAQDLADFESEQETAHNALAQAMANETARVNQKIADDIATESALRVAEETKIRQELANEKAALQKEIDDDVAAEAALRTAEETKIRGEIAQALADAKAHAEAKDLADRTAQSEFDAAQSNRISALEAKFEGDQSVDAKIQAVQDNLDAFEEAQETAHNALLQKDADLQKAIEDEAAARAEEDGKLQSAIDAINHAENGILAQAKALDKEDRDAQALVDKAQDDRIKALEDANKEGGAVAKAIAQVAQDLADFEGEQATKEAAQDKAISDEADRAKGEEARIEGLVTAEASRADAEEKRIVGLVESEASAARAAEEQLGKDIAAEAAKAREEEGKLDQAIKAEAERAAAAEAKALEDAKKYADDQIAAADVPGQIQEAVSGVNATIEGEATARDNADKALGLRIDGEAQTRENADNALSSRLDNIEGEGEGSVKKALADAKAYADEKIEEVNGAAADLEGRVKANEDKLAGLENATVKAEIEAAQAAAEKHADDAITALVDSAPEAMNTLNELATAINANKGVYDAYVEQHAQAMAQMKSDLQKEIDDDVAAEADLRVAADNKIREDFAAADNALKAALQKEIDDDVKAEADIARAAEKANADAIAAINNAENGILAQAKAHANGLDQAMNSRMEAVEGFVEDHDHSEIEGKIEALENANKDGGAVANAIKAAQDAAGQAQADVDAVEKRLDDEGGLVDRLEAVEEFKNAHSHADMEQDIADNAAAIEVLNGDENKDGSVAKAVKAEADRAKLAEEALDAKIAAIFKAYDGNKEYPDLAPLA